MNQVLKFPKTKCPICKKIVPRDMEANDGTDWHKCLDPIDLRKVIYNIANITKKYETGEKEYLSTDWDYVLKLCKEVL